MEYRKLGKALLKNVPRLRNSPVRGGERDGSRLALALVLAASSIAASCPGPPPPAPEPALGPRFELPTTAEAWRVPALHLPPEQVTDLLIGLREAEGLFAVRVDDQGWRPLSRCFLHHRRARYLFVPELATAANEWRGEEELYKDFGAFAQRVAKQRNGRLKLTTMRWLQSGTWRAVEGSEAVQQATRSGLTGECGDANYYIDEISVGAGFIEAEHVESPLGEQWAVARRNVHFGGGDFSHCPKEITETCQASKPLPAPTAGLVQRPPTAAEPGAPSAEGDASDGSDPPHAESPDAGAGCPEHPPPRCDVPLWVTLRVIE